MQFIEYIDIEDIEMCMQLSRGAFGILIRNYLITTRNKA